MRTGSVDGNNGSSAQGMGAIWVKSWDKLKEENSKRCDPEQSVIIVIITIIVTIIVIITESKVGRIIVRLTIPFKFGVPVTEQYH
jgi:hypothetical protein